MALAPALLPNKIRGCIVGGALGDAIGLFTEFLSAGRARNQYGPNPRFKLLPPAPPGQEYKTMLMDNHRASFEEAGWTDDTDQSLLILMLFLHGGGKTDGLDELDLAKRLRHWVEYGFRPLDRLATDVGNTVRSVVGDPQFLEDPLKTSSRIWERGGKTMAANGAVMRTPVIGALFLKDQERLYRAAIKAGAVTHADPRCLVSCTVASSLVASAIKDELRSDGDIRRVLDAAIIPLQNHTPPLSAQYIEELHSLVWKETLRELELDAFRSIGYTYKCLASGVWALRQGVNAIQQAALTGAAIDHVAVFERAITDITMAGGDSDTNGAVAGSLLGALFGYSNLPPDWVQDLRHRDWLVSKADAAAFLVLGEGEPYDHTADRDNLVDGGKGDMTSEDLERHWKELRISVEERTKSRGI